MEKESSKRIRELPFWTHTGPSVVRVSISWIENCLIHQLLGRTLRRSWLRNGESLDCDLMSSNISWKQKLKRIKLFPHLWFRKKFSHISVQFSSVTQSCPTLCDPMNCSTPGLPVQNQLPESTQTHVHWVSDAIQPSHPLSSPSPPALNLSQHQGLFKWVSSSHQVAKVLEFQLQYQSFQWIFRTDLL